MCQQAAAATRPYHGLVRYLRLILAPASYRRCGHRPDLDEDYWLARYQLGLMNWGVSRRGSSIVSRSRCAGRVIFLEGNTSPAMLRIAGGSSSTAH